MKISIISGSPRKDAQSAKVSRWIERAVKRLDGSAETHILDLHEKKLPLWSEEQFGDDAFTALWKPISSELFSSDAFVIVCPEWSGMATPHLKNFFLLCSKELYHKPAMLVSVSSGINGAYPIAELRSSSYKNTHICYTPEHVIVRNVESILNDDTYEGAEKYDLNTKERIDYGLRVLFSYAKALERVREDNVLEPEKYKYGM